MEIQLVHLEETDSTNRVLKELAREGAPEGTLVVADRQTAGRGRLGRSFFSPDGGLYFSLLLRPALPSFDTTLITTAAAVAGARAVDAFAVARPDYAGPTQIKWVNDLYLRERKITGILAEGLAQGEAFSVVLGVGINILPPEGGFPADIAQKAGSVTLTRDTDISPSEMKSRLLALFIREFEALYEALPDKRYLNEYRERSMLTGKTVSYEKDGLPHRGTVLGIDDEAGLLLDEGGETVCLRAGEVSVAFE